jgi:hypothetical protein
MTMRPLARRPLALLLAGLLSLAGLLATAAPVFANAQVVIVNINAPGEGFNDPSPRTPIGGNPGTTLGEQRLIAFQFAASIWGATLDSAVPISVQAEFLPLQCTAATAQIGAAGPLQMFANFPGAPRPDTWYVAALANRLAFTDLAPGPTNSAADDIMAVFNGRIGTDPTCLTGRDWYYGLDANHGPNRIDLVTVLLHEFAHGLGFGTFLDPTTGKVSPPYHDVYEHFLFDTTTGLHFDQMTDAQRVAASINSRRVVWDGAHVTAQVPSTLTPGTPLLTVSAPATPAGTAGIYAVGTATFGPALTSPGVTANLVAALDAANPAGPSTFDGCTALINAAAVAGNLAFINRGGTCNFTVQAKNAQLAGAVGVLIADNVPTMPPAAIGGSDPTITIPVVRLGQADGQLLRAALASGPVTATLGVNLAVRLGADASGRALLAAPNPVRPGTSLAHWDVIATPNLLMEPAINPVLTHTLDLTVPLFRDIGWAPDADLDGVLDDQDQCAASILTSTVVIDQCDSGTPNILYNTGCTIADLVRNCQPSGFSSETKDFRECVKDLTKNLRKSGVFTNKQAHAIDDCVKGKDDD